MPYCEEKNKKNPRPSAFFSTSAPPPFISDGMPAKFPMRVVVSVCWSGVQVYVGGENGAVPIWLFSTVILRTHLPWTICVVLDSIIDCLWMALLFPADLVLNHHLISRWTKWWKFKSNLSWESVHPKDPSSFSKSNSAIQMKPWSLVI